MVGSAPATKASRISEGYISLTGRLKETPIWQTQVQRADLALKKISRGVW